MIYEIRRTSRKEKRKKKRKRKKKITHRLRTKYVTYRVDSSISRKIMVGSHLSQDHFSQSLFQPKFICLRVYSRRKVTRFRLTLYVSS